MSGEIGRYSVDQSSSLVPRNSFCWGTTDWSWAVAYSSKENGAQVRSLDTKKF